MIDNELHKFLYDIEVSARRILKKHNQNNNNNKEIAKTKEKNQNLSKSPSSPLLIKNSSTKYLPPLLHHTESLSSISTIHVPKEKQSQNHIIKSKTSISSSNKEKLLNSPLLGSNKIKHSKYSRSIKHSNNNVIIKNSIPDHAVENRNCTACWTNSCKITGCEHGIKNLIKENNIETELQGPTSWECSDLRIKYRNEKEREDVYKKCIQLKEKEDELERMISDDINIDEIVHEASSIPNIERHPLIDRIFKWANENNLYVLSKAINENMQRYFMIDLQRVWLTNLEHVEYRIDITENSTKGLKSRRDLDIIKNGYCQIPSVSLRRALELQAGIVSSLSSRNEIETSSKLIETRDSTPIKSQEKFKTNIQDVFLPSTLDMCRRKQYLYQVPGTIPFGKKGLWFKNTYDDKEYTQAVAMFIRDQNMTFNKNNIVVLVALAIDVPFFSPLCFCWDFTQISPPIETEYPFIKTVSQKMLHGSLENRSSFTSDVENWRPNKVIILNSYNDPTDLPKSEHDGHFFRQWYKVDSLEPKYEINPCCFGVTDPTSMSNQPDTHGRFCWHSDKIVTEIVIRIREPKDYLYILRDHSKHLPGSALYFKCLMNYENMESLRVLELQQIIEICKERERKELENKNKRELENKIELGRKLLQSKNQQLVGNKDENLESIRYTKFDKEYIEEVEMTLLSLLPEEKKLKYENKQKVNSEWRRLRKSYIPLSFASKVRERKIQPNTAGYTGKPNKASIAGMIDPVTSQNYVAPDFSSHFKAYFVPDIAIEIETMLKSFSNVSDTWDMRSNKTNSPEWELGQEKSEIAEMNPQQKLDYFKSKAILYTRNNNIDDLEKMLNEGIDINTSDENGNTLFILACQQGNKRTAKLLMRRMCNINAQNANGNTGLHYCFAYNHKSLADYLIEKGASYHIVNAEGLTCYEGLKSSDIE